MTPARRPGPLLALGAAAVLVAVGLVVLTSGPAPTIGPVPVAADRPGARPSATTRGPALPPTSATATPTTRTTGPGGPTTPASPATRSAPASAAGRGCPACWHPAVHTTWNWVLSETPSPPFRRVQVYDVDGFETPAGTVAALHRAGIKVICYLSVGSYENWRPDARQFPARLLGRPLDGWPGERWLDVRDIRTTGSVLARIMSARLDLCRGKGFDAVEFDNMDGWTNRTGFPLTAADQLAYVRFLADAAHTRGLSAAMKNDVDQIEQISPYVDMAVNEECNRYHECAGYSAFVRAGKPVFQAEYGSSSRFCAADATLGLNGLLLPLDLDDSVFRPCP